MTKSRHPDGAWTAIAGAPSRAMHGVDSQKELRRIEGFTDAVFAIACTLLVLGIAVPHVGEAMQSGGLWPALRHLWPSIVAYLISFESIFVAWAAHHKYVGVLERSSKPFLYANGLLLLAITFVPFPTAILAEYIVTPYANVAVMIYSATQLALNLSFVVWLLCLFRPVRLLPDSWDSAVARKIVIQTLGGTATYVATTIASYWFPISGLVVIVACQILWIGMSVSEPEN
jgi:uncharacterized membrane protein